MACGHRRDMNQRPRFLRVALESSLVLALVCATLALSSRGVGVTWDECTYFLFSDSVNRWLDEGHQFDQPALDRYWNYDGFLNPHPPLMKVASAFAVRILGKILDFPLSYRLAHHAFAALCLAIVYALLRRETSCFRAASAIAIILLQPRLFGDLMIATTDGPVAMAWVVAAIASWRIAVADDDRDRAYLRLIVLVMTAIAAATKFTGLLLVLPLGLYHLLGGRIREAIWTSVAAFTGLCAAVLVSPDKWRSPATAALQYLTYPFMRESIPIYTFYLGEVYPFHLPWHYFDFMTAITVPPALWLFLFGWRNIPPALRGAAQSCGVSLAFWIVLMHLPNTPRHDGVREFLSVFPLLGILFWAGLQGVARRIEETSYREPRGKWASVLGTTAGIALALITFLSHPHELSYYNGLIGGIRGAEQAGMETTYFLESIGPAMLRAIDANVAKGRSLYMAPSWMELLQLYRQHGMLRSDFVLLPMLTNVRPDYFLIVRRRALIDDDWYVRQPAIYEVSYEGVSLAKLVDGARSTPQ